MDSLFRKVRKNPAAGKHSKLGEGWDVNREAVTEGVCFYLKYLGSTLLEELPQGESYGEGVSSRAVQRIVDMARTQGSKLIKVSLKVTPKGICVVNMESNELLLDVTIYRISFCTADKNHDKLFAFIARNRINETMECHAFFCGKQKIAQAVTLSVSQAFTLAQDEWERVHNLKNSHKNTKNHKNSQLSNSNHVPSVTRNNESAPQVDLLSDTHPRLPKPDVTRSMGTTDDMSSSPRRGWQTFDDMGEDKNSSFDDDSTEPENLDDCFDQLAENRSRSKDNQSLAKSPVFPTFSTDLRTEDLADGVRDYLNGNGGLEVFSRTKSSEDLFNI